MTTFSKIAKATLLSAFVAIALNYLWNYIAIHAFDCDQPPAPWMVMVGVSTFITTCIGGLVFFLLQKYTSRGTLFFTIISLIAALLSIFPTTKTVMPDGLPAPHQFMLLAAPMHILAALVAVVVIPKYSRS